MLNYLIKIILNNLYRVGEVVVVSSLEIYGELSIYIGL